MIYDIVTDDDYRDALHRFLEICDALKSEDEVKEMFLLMTLMEKYERNSCSFN
ncbi:MAG: hypothetical protein ACK5M7_00405 [Draconibacterium sp.]